MRDIDKISMMADKINEPQKQKPTSTRSGVPTNAPIGGTGESSSLKPPKMKPPKKKTEPKLYKLGIMQGRLSPRLDNGNYQYFPKKTWTEEFILAKKLGFDYIELVVDDIDEFNKDYINKIKQISKETGVATTALCLDAISKANTGGLNKNGKLNRAIELGKEIGVEAITLPYIEKNELYNPTSIENLISFLNRYSFYAAKYNINLCLELDLNVQLLNLVFTEIEKGVFYPYNIGTTLDSGNLYFYGLTSNDTLKVRHVHIKDRLVSGESCILGKGCTNFAEIIPNLTAKMSRNHISFLASDNYYEQNYTLQGARSETFNNLASEIGIVKQQKSIFKHLMAKYGHKPEKTQLEIEDEKSGNTSFPESTGPR